MLAVLFAFALTEAGLRELFLKSAPRIDLPKGTVMLSRPLALPSNTEVRGEGLRLVMSASFKGRAALLCEGCHDLKISGIAVDGNRARLAQPIGIAPYDIPFANYYPVNGLLADRARNLTIRGLKFEEIANFAILVSRSQGLIVEDVRIARSGSRNDKGRNNTTGGILIEEGTSDFLVRGCVFQQVLGNGVWTHSLYPSPRNVRGRIVGNHFVEIGRDAIQVGHASEIQVTYNTGARIGYPVEAVDVEGLGTPVAIDTAGNVDKSVYAWNRFEETNGKCVDLDGFHNGEVRENVCVNRGTAASYPFGHYGIVMNNTNPDMQSRNIRITGNHIDGTKFGGIFVIGEGHTISGNRLLNLNQAGCNETAEQFGCIYDKAEPDMLQAGIYLGRKAERPGPARESAIFNNEITGHRMKDRCILAAPGIDVASHRIERNECRNSNR